MSKSCENLSESFYFFFIEEFQFSSIFFDIDIFWKLQFLKHLKQFLLKLYPFFVCWFWSFGKNFENDLRVIFDQWTKLYSGFDAEPEIHPVKKGHDDKVTFKFEKENFAFEKGTKTTKYRGYKQT